MEDIADRIEVPAVTRGEVDELVDAVLDGPVAVATGDELWRLSDGNVLFLHELVVGALEAGALEEVDGSWRHGGRLADTSRLEDAIRSRLAGFGPEAATALQIVALGGRIGSRAFFEKLVDAELLAQLDDADLVTGR